MEDVFRDLCAIILVESGLMVALLFVWCVVGWLLGPRVGTDGGEPLRSLQGELRTRTACSNCGWQRLAATVASPPLQVCPLCGLAAEGRREAPQSAPHERRRGSIVSHLRHNRESLKPDR